MCEARLLWRAANLAGGRQRRQCDRRWLVFRDRERGSEKGIEENDRSTGATGEECLEPGEFCLRFIKGVSADVVTLLAGRFEGCLLRVRFRKAATRRGVPNFFWTPARRIWI
jgi:hypothetical protein